MHALTLKDFTIPVRTSGSHKGQNGVVLVIGGSEDFVGAVALAGVSALRAGCDLVIVAAPAKVAWAVNALSPDLITKKLPGKTMNETHFPMLKKLAQKADVLLIGNGIGTAAVTKRLVRKLLTLPNKKVLDADALKMVMAKDVTNSIITPHAKELEVFLKNSKLPGTTSTSSLKKNLHSFFTRGNVLVQKGKEDILLGDGKAAKNTTGNAGMTKGGTGDVLAGLCAGYYAQLGDPWQAACNATYVTGKLGDDLKKRKGHTYLASDMADAIEKFK